MAELAKNQHYVPQFLLRGFRAKKKKGQIHVFDKHEERTFRTAIPIRNVAAETGFYNYTEDSRQESAEPFLANMETDCSRVINKIRDTASLAALTPRDREHLTLFTAIQAVRVKQMRLMLEETNRVLRDKILALGGDPADVEGFDELDAEGVKKASIYNLSIAKDLAPHIHSKAWLLMRAPAASPFYISDNPVVLQSTVPQPEHRGIGMGVDGVEIYLPISTRLVLLFLCPKLASQMVAGAETARVLKWQLGIPAPADHLAPIANSIRLGQPMDIEKENVDNLNSLQVFSATRFVFSCADTFALAKTMLSEEPHLKHNSTFQVM